jgi:hypothetical protein
MTILPVNLGSCADGRRGVPVASSETLAATTLLATVDLNRVSSLSYSRAVSWDYELGRLLLHLEHRPPDSGPCAILIAEHPQIPTACAISFTRTLVDHVVSKGNNSCIANNISFVIVILKFMNSGVFTKIPKAGEELFATLDPPGEARKDRYYVRVDHRYESFHIAIEPGTVDALHR